MSARNTNVPSPNRDINPPLPSPPPVKIGTRPVTVIQKAIDKNRHQLSFSVNITSYNGNPINQTISVEVVCDPKTIVDDNMVETTVAQTPEECVNNWIQQVKDVYTFE